MLKDKYDYKEAKLNVVYERSHTPTDFVLLSNATVQMTFRKGVAIIHHENVVFHYR